MKIELLEQTTSTNDEIKRYLSGNENAIVCARVQTGGRGTKGRSFLSGEGGVYLTALTFYQNFLARNAFLVMAHAAVAVCRTAEEFGVTPHIKWANDVFVDKQKLAGITVENVFLSNFLSHSMVGIGLNVCNDLSSLGGIATSLQAHTARKLSVDEVRERLITNLRREPSFDEYLARVRFLGEEIVVREGEKSYTAIARRILPDGRLEIQRENEIFALSAAEISILPHF